MVVWREEGFGEGEVRAGSRVEIGGCECGWEWEDEVVVVSLFVVSGFGALGYIGETIGKREVEGDGGMAVAVAVVEVLLFVGDCGLTVAV